jgi:hypothetical protein
MDWQAWTIDNLNLNLHLDQSYNSMQYLALPNMRFPRADTACSTHD